MGSLPVVLIAQSGVNEATGDGAAPWGVAATGYMALLPGRTRTRWMSVS